MSSGRVRDRAVTFILMVKRTNAAFERLHCPRIHENAATAGSRDESKETLDSGASSATLMKQWVLYYRLMQEQKT